MSMLDHSPVTCMLPVKDLARARAFYEQRLGLSPLGAKPDGKFIYRCGGTELALFPKPEGTQATHTALAASVEQSLQRSLAVVRAWAQDAEPTSQGHGARSAVHCSETYYKAGFVQRSGTS